SPVRPGVPVTDPIEREDTDHGVEVHPEEGPLTERPEKQEEQHGEDQEDRELEELEHPPTDHPADDRPTTSEIRAAAPVEESPDQTHEGIRALDPEATINLTGDLDATVNLSGGEVPSLEPDAASDIARGHLKGLLEALVF